jgi:DNA-directed RNA polymerase subunit RPC12/RpoP
MASCPNCGRQTQRTKDWACQWCGYPLISKAFKKIDKTFKELQEERALGSMASEADMDAKSLEFDYETETAHESEHDDSASLQPEVEPDRKPQKQPKQKFSLFGKPKPRPESKPQPAPNPEPRHEVRREPQRPQPERPVIRREPQTSLPVYKTEPKPEPPPVERPASPPPPVNKPEAERQEPMITPPPVPRVELPPVPPAYQPPAPKAETPPAPQAAAPPSQPPARAPEPRPSKPEIVIEYQPPYVSSVKPDDIKDGIAISAEDLDALFKADKSGVNIKLNGKTIVLKGVVEKVFIREHLDIRYIMVTGKKKLTWSSRCTFEKDNAGKASRLTENSDVAVRAKYDGYGKNIIFKDCEVL